MLKRLKSYLQVRKYSESPAFDALISVFSQG